MENVYFEPWVGENYWEGGIFGKKILVIGNSHYCGHRTECNNCGVDGYCFDEDCSSFTTNVVNQYLDRDEDEWESWYNTYWKFECALCGYKTDKDDSYDIWNSIAFYNYLQTAVESPYDPGNDEDYENSESAFWEVLEDLHPDYIIMWGDRVWNQSPSYNGDGEYYELDDGTEISVLGIHHPSWRYFNWEEENCEINNFLNDDDDYDDSDESNYDDDDYDDSDESNYDDEDYDDSDESNYDDEDYDDSDENDYDDDSYDDQDDNNDEENYFNNSDDSNNDDDNSSGNSHPIISSIVLPLILSLKKK